MHKHGHHSAASQIHAAERAQAQTYDGCCTPAKPSHEAIAHRAYDIYVKTGSQQGHCRENWQKAEAELQTAGQHA
jgi:hypothetical protein